MTAEMSVQITLALAKTFFLNPSAGIGRQDELKLRWPKVVEVQVLFWILEKKK